MIDSAKRALLETLVKKHVTTIRFDYDVYRFVVDTVASDPTFSSLGCLSADDLFDEMHACAKRGIVNYLDIRLPLNPQTKTLYMPKGSTLVLPTLVLPIDNDLADR